MVRTLVVCGAIAGLAPTVLSVSQQTSVPATQPSSTGSGIDTRVNAYIAPYVATQAFSGSILVSHHGNVLIARGYGVNDRDHKTLPSIDTRFGIGSVTKLFTAAAIELLAERGQLSLTDHLPKFFPGFPNGEAITITHLLQHSSGLKDYYSWPAYMAGRTAPISDANFLSELATQPLDFPAGTKSAYSNTGYFVLACIVERVSGLPYDEFIRRNLFDPLGMKASGSLLDGGKVKNLATGYDPGFPPSRLQPAEAVSRTWLKGNGSLYSTAADLDLIRFGGHLPKGGYDVQTDGRHTKATSASPIH